MLAFPVLAGDLGARPSSADGRRGSLPFVVQDASLDDYQWTARDRSRSAGQDTMPDLSAMAAGISMLGAAFAIGTSPLPAAARREAAETRPLAPAAQEPAATPSDAPASARRRFGDKSLDEAATQASPVAHIRPSPIAAPLPASRGPLSPRTAWSLEPSTDDRRSTASPAMLEPLHHPVNLAPLTDKESSASTSSKPEGKRLSPLPKSASERPSARDSERLGGFARSASDAAAFVKKTGVPPLSPRKEPTTMARSGSKVETPKDARLANCKDKDAIRGRAHKYRGKYEARHVLYVRDIFNQIDVDKDGVISFSDLRAAMDSHRFIKDNDWRHHVTLDAFYQRFFNVLLKENEATEVTFTQLLRVVFPFANERDMKEMLRLSFPKLYETPPPVPPVRGLTPAEVEEIEALFRRYDADDDGFIHFNELRQATAHLPMMNRQACRELLAEWDTDGDGMLSLKEFVEGMKQIYVMRDDDRWKSPR
eukprot:TRINITY_DN7044_c0_g1_i1.p1 TRINITY_DN7044_c0_g1~~TRINITY_DN7044_c0_g1_i1.p1  ORF type:complete len:481 (+),score=116.40 TRINITY_DN7044_c0_g1_i1:111-1553(+)